METRNALAEWRSVAPLLRGLVEGRTEAELDRRADPRAMTLRETLHHVVEANVVASSIVVAALGSPGALYDWSWMVPAPPWMERMRYGEMPVEPALRLAAALNEWVAVLVERLEDGLDRPVLLRDAPGAEPRAATVREVLLQEVEHARHEVRRARGEAGPHP